jgi:hypothetical protein
VSINSNNNLTKVVMLRVQWGGLVARNPSINNANKTVTYAPMEYI